MKEKIMPSLVLTLTCVIIAGLLAIAYEATYVDTTGVMTDKLKTACTEIFGNGEYTMLVNKDEEGNPIPITYGEAVSVIKGSDGRYLFEITADGYEKGGITLLIGIENNAVAGIYPLQVNETAGLGAKVKKQDFLSKFEGVDDVSDMDSIDAITSATYSTNGVKHAVSLALEAYKLAAADNGGGK